MPETARATRRSDARPPASLHPRGSPAGSSPPRCAWTSARFGRPGLRVDRVAELRRVRHRDRRLQRRRGERPVLERRALAGSLERQRRAGGREDARRPREAETDEVVERRAGLQRGELVARLRGVERHARRAAVDEHQPGEVPRAGPAAEVPGRVGGRDRPAERVPAEDDRAAAAARGADHPAQVLHRDPHPPPAGGRGLRVGGRREVLRDAAAEPAEVVREQRRRPAPAPPGRGRAPSGPRAGSRAARPPRPAIRAAARPGCAPAGGSSRRRPRCRARARARGARAAARP